MLYQTNDTDPRIPRSVLTMKLAAIDRRRAEIEALLALKREGDQETGASSALRAELRELLGQRREIDAILNPRSPEAINPHYARSLEKARQRNIATLRSAIKGRRQSLLHQIERAEATGEHRHALDLRLRLMRTPESVCEEFKLDPALLEECGDVFDLGEPVPEAAPEPAPKAAPKAKQKARAAA